MSTAPTPGPWEFRRDGFVYSLATGERVCSPHSTLISGSLKDDIKDLKRNARLIAAAPDILYELEDLAAWRDIIEKLPTFPGKGAMLDDFDSARAAINKAKGL